MLTLGSLFNGLGGWPLAGKRCGVSTLWESEVENFCEALMKHHFPEVRQLGDITKLAGAKLPPVDIITAGSPCQDLSVAGKQEGLKGARSGLFRNAIGLVRDMRRATGGRCPRFFVCENVPGAFSSNRGMDFRAVLEEIGEAAIPMPRNGRWASAGLVELPECQIAWRVLDAQYWGVPQRRKRIFLVADFGGRRAGEVLFEREGVPRDPAAGGEAQEGATAGTESGARAASGNCLTPWDVESKRIYTGQGKSACLAGSDGGGGRNPAGLVFAAGFNANASSADSFPVLHEKTPPLRAKDRAAVFSAGFKAGQSRAGGLGYEAEKAATLSAGHSGLEPTVAVYSFDSLASNSMKSANPHSGCRKVDIARTLDASPPDPSKNQGGIAVYDMTHADEVMRPVEGGKCQTLNARMGTGGNQVPVVQTFALEGNGARPSHRGPGWSDDEKSFTLNTVDRHVVCVGNGQMNQAMRLSDKARSLDCMHDQQAVMVRKSVRRLTPLECERLQGLPDGYTLIDDRTCSDTARYKALGNGMAQPCADFVIRRIVEVCNAD